MKRFYYKAILNNEKISGNVLAKDQNQALNILKSKDMLVISLKKQSFLTQDIIIGGLSKKELSFFCRQLLFFVSSGVSLVNVTEVPSNKKLEKSFFAFRENILQGNSLSKSLELEKFPVLLCNMIKIGEATGRLEEILEQMEFHYEKEYENNREISSILIYPTVITIAMILVIAITMIYLIPSFTSMFVAQDVSLPAITQILINTSNFFIEGWFFIWIFIFFSIFFILIKLKKTDVLIFKIPIIKNIARIFITARFSSAIYIMLKSGVPILEAMDIVKDLFKNTIYKEKIEIAKESLSKGTSLKSAFENTLMFHPLIINLIKLGEETGTLVQSLEKANIYFEKEQAIIIKNIKKHIEPTITIIMGVILLFIMLAIMLPTFSVIQVI